MNDKFEKLNHLTMELCGVVWDMNDAELKILKADYPLLWEYLENLGVVETIE